MGPLVDELRQLNTDFGLRPYRVFSVVVAWDGGAVGRGTPRVVSELEFLPTPLVNLKPLRKEMRAAGKIEQGSAFLSELSPRYTEDDIDLLFRRGRLEPGQEAYVEVREDARDGSTKRRRFQVRGVPFREAESFQWVVTLTSEQQDRERNGEIGGRDTTPPLRNPLMER